MTYANSVEIVDAFWESRNPGAVDDFVVEDFVLTKACQPVVGRASFTEWVRAFLAHVDDCRFQVIGTFQNADGSRVASRWQITGRNNGVLGTEPDGQPISFTGTAVWAIRADGKLLHNWVERASWELSTSDSTSQRPEPAMAGVRQFDEERALGKALDVFTVRGFRDTSMLDLAAGTGVQRVRSTTRTAARRRSSSKRSPGTPRDS